MRKVLALGLLLIGSAIPANAGLIRHVLKPTGKALGKAVIVTVKATSHTIKKLVY